MSEYNAAQQVRIADARDAVIEAAKAWHGSCFWDTATHPLDALLLKAVEALLAAEKEE